MPNLKKEEKGITMAALILMIIIMLILVTVSISIISGSDGVINNSKNVMEKAELESLKERIREEIKQEEIKAKLLGQEVSDETIQNIITPYSNYFEYDANEKTVYTIEDDDMQILISLKKEIYTDGPYGKTYKIALNNQSATTSGTEEIYEKYNEKYSITSSGSEMTTTQNGIVKPTKNNLYFCGYYTEENGNGVRYIDANGYLTSAASNTYFTQNGTLYACWKNIPDEYQEVLYIESTGTQYIDTKYVPNKDTEIEMLIYLTDTQTEYQLFFGVNENSNQYYIGKGSRKNYNISYHYAGEDLKSISFTDTNYTGMKKIHTKKNIIIETEDGTTSTGENTNQTYVFQNTAFVFAERNDGDDPRFNTKMKLYSLKIWENSELKRDFVPCYAKTSVTNVEGTTCAVGTLGLYDKANNKFYTNKGSGTFNKGSDV